MSIDTLVFDASQITSKANGNNPKWNDVCHTLSEEAGRATVIIRSDDEGTDSAGERCNDKD